MRNWRIATSMAALAGTCLALGCWDRSLSVSTPRSGHYSSSEVLAMAPTRPVETSPTPAPTAIPQAPISRTDVEKARSELSQRAQDITPPAASQTPMPPTTPVAPAAVVEPVEQLTLPEAHPLPSEPRPSPPRATHSRTNDPRYLVVPGDRIKVEFMESWKNESEYRLLPGDAVRVEVVTDSGAWSSSSIDRTVQLQPDGKMSLPFLGVFDAAGRTTHELAKDLFARYGELYVEPHVLVTLVETGEGLRVVHRAIHEMDGRGTLVSPDGTVALPRIGTLKVDGLNVLEIEAELNERYRRAIPGFAVRVHVFGHQPGGAPDHGAPESKRDDDGQ